ncbi:hypothetical protein EVAR_101078_1 [Eumeta japonica]|uniref:Uncharacterized protein n=1 Tax=Eumeta variegata TaxID=151549 RepID=A0A4C2AHX2_EUMVA|nr:hypothetical protein EVAR_101078_1 [Eumeta japonica]
MAGGPNILRQKRSHVCRAKRKTVPPNMYPTTLQKARWSEFEQRDWKGCGAVSGKRNQQPIGARVGETSREIYESLERGCKLKPIARHRTESLWDVIYRVIERNRGKPSYFKPNCNGTRSGRRPPGGNLSLMAESILMIRIMQKLEGKTNGDDQPPVTSEICPGLTHRLLRK